MAESAPTRPARPTRRGAAPSREAAKEETREALLLAGLAEFAEKGLDAPSLDAICARAGYTRGAFYVHFKDRDDFLVAAMERVLGPFLDAVIAGGGAPQDVERTIERFVELVQTLHAAGGAPILPVAPAAAPSELPAQGLVQFHRLLEACARSTRLRARLVGLLRGAIERVAGTAKAGQEAGSVRPDVDADALAALLVALALGVITALEIGVPLDLATMRNALLACVAAGAARRA